MDRGTYLSASAGLYQFRKLEVVNNNLANINTPGFKKQILTGVAQTFDQTLAGLVAKEDPYAKKDQQRTPGVVNLQTATDFSQGPIRNTGNELDVALRNANDFFVVDTPEGPQYTRSGNFSIGSQGELVTMDGFQVQGNGGAISVNGASVTIAPNGVVSVKGQQVGRLQVVHFDDPASLERVGSTRFKAAAGAPQPNEVEVEVEPRALEMSNVSAISSMIDLITASRAFQAYTKSAETVDTMNQTAINQIGRSRG